MTKEEYEIGVKYSDVIRRIIVDHACSNIPIELQEFLHKNKYSDCMCSSGIFNGTSKFHRKWLQEKGEYEEAVKCKRGRKSDKVKQ